MTNRSKLLVILLFLGLFFSAIFGFKFSLNNGFEFKGFYLNISFQFFDLAMGSSNQLYLTSQTIGYLFFITLGVLANQKFNLYITRDFITLGGFYIFNGIVIFNDIRTMILDLNNSFHGQHFRAGLAVFFVGIGVIYQFFRRNKLKKPRITFS